MTTIKIILQSYIVISEIVCIVYSNDNRLIRKLGDLVTTANQKQLYNRIQEFSQGAKKLRGKFRSKSEM